LRQNILTRHGYLKGDDPEYQRRRLMSMPIPDVPVAAGYTVRALGDVEEFPARSLVCGKRSMPMSQTIVMKVGTGITTSSTRRSTAWISMPT